MRDHHDRLAQLADGVAEEGEDLGAGAGVEIAGGLVGEDDVGLARQRAGAGDALLLAAGELARPVREAAGEADGVHHGVQPLLVDLAAGDVHREGDVLERRQGGQQVERLEDEADVIAAQLGQLLVPQPDQLGVADHRGAGGDGVQTGHAVHQRGLAGAGRTHDRGVLPLREGHAHVVEGDDSRLALAVDLVEAGGAGGRLAGTDGGCGRRGHGELLSKCAEVRAEA